MSTQKTDVALRDETAVAPAQSTSLIEMVIAAARDPEVDADKMEKMADLGLKLRAAEKEERFQQDKVAALMEMPTISKAGAIHGKGGSVMARFSKFEDINRIVKPILSAHNLAINFDVNHSGNLVTVTPILSHTNGFVERGGEMALPIDTTGAKNATQGSGSAASYGKRHAMKAMLNIIEDGEDNDGQGDGSAPIKPEHQKLIDAGRSEAMQGTDAYSAWFKALTVPQRGWLVFEGYHDQNKDAATKADG